MSNYNSNKYTGTVIKAGNSYAVRVPKDYVDEVGLQLGQKIVLPDVTAERKFDSDAFRAAVVALQKARPYREIKDPVAWQRKLREGWERSLPGRE